MIKTEYDKREVIEVKTVPVTETCNCDVCGKTIFRKNVIDKTVEPSRYVYFDVMTMLTNLGNDSIDTIMYEHICSDECLRSRIEDYIKSCGDDTEFNPKIEITLEYRS